MITSKGSEKGSISIIAALFITAMIGIFIAVMSHSQFVSGYSRTREAASNVARVGVQEIDFQHLEETDEMRIDDRQARRAMQRHIKQYPNTKIVGLRISDDYIEVTVAETIKSVSGKTRTIEATAAAEPFADD